MVAIRQLTAEKFSVRLPSVLVVKCPSPELSSKTFFLFAHAGDKAVLVPTVNRQSTIQKVTVLCVECVGICADVLVKVSAL
jgi:hypothetical protein